VETPIEGQVPVVFS